MKGRMNYLEPEMPQMDVTLELDLIRAHGPRVDVMFSGGKDSCCLKELCRMAGVEFRSYYNNTTIDPPELVRFIKKQHPDVIWCNPAMPMMTAVATLRKSPPTRRARWCCERYKELTLKTGNPHLVGVRAAESVRRRNAWLQWDGKRNILAPILLWSDEDVWTFIRERNLPYCELYDQGFKRLGCVGCPLAGREGQDREFARWPNFERNWHRAIVANWERWHSVPRIRDGKPRFQAKFKSGEELWLWWRTYKAPTGDCGWFFPMPGEDDEPIPHMHEEESLFDHADDPIELPRNAVV
jgi:phosphoadenosine phosphosulfate reductase